MPFNEEGILKDLIVVELLAKGGRELLHLRIGIDEKLAHGLEQVLFAVFLFLRDELREHRLKSVPMLHDISMSAENTAHCYVHLVFARDIELELKLTDLTKDVISFTCARISDFIIYEGLKFFTRTQDLWVVERHVDRVEDVDLSVGIRRPCHSLGLFLLFSVYFLFLSRSTCLILSSLSSALAAGRIRRGGLVHCSLAWSSLGCKLGIGRVVIWDVFLQLLASLVYIVHLVVCGAA